MRTSSTAPARSLRPFRALTRFSVALVAVYARVLNGQPPPLQVSVTFEPAGRLRTRRTLNAVRSRSVLLSWPTSGRNDAAGAVGLPGPGLTGPGVTGPGATGPGFSGSVTTDFTAKVRLISRTLPA